LRDYFKVNSILEEYNNKISSIASLFDSRSLFSPTLCRIESQTNLFKDIFVSTKKKKRKINFKNILRYFSFMLKPLRDIFLIKNSDKKLLKENQNRLFITYGDYRNETDKNNWREEIFRGLKPNKSDQLLVLSLGKSINDILKNIKYTNTCNSNEFIYSSYSLISFKDVINAFFESTLYFTNFIFGTIKLKIYVGKVNIKFPLITSIFKDYFKGLIYTNCLFKRKWINLLAINPQTIIFPWESHCWERILLNTIYSNNNFNDIKTIGYQHTGFSYGLLQHFSTKSDALLKINPKILYSCGDIQKKKLESIEGLYNVKKYTIGSLRCKSNPNINKLNLKKNKKIKTISFAFGYNEDNYQFIIDELKRINNSIKIYLFFHPLNYKFKPKLNGASNIVCKFKRENKIIEKSDLLIVDDNSMMIEGWNLGVPTVIYDSDSYDLTKRDWDSPILHINKYTIGKLEKDFFKKDLNNSIEIYLKTKYYKNYFKEITFSDFKKFLLQN
tara:strand:+ start:7181 stop:8680 length:1500 start_codon:yes stop_codon:yes gene_type:complete